MTNRSSALPNASETAEDDEEVGPAVARVLRNITNAAKKAEAEGRKNADDAGPSTAPPATAPPAEARPAEARMTTRSRSVKKRGEAGEPLEKDAVVRRLLAEDEEEEAEAPVEEAPGKKRTAAEDIDATDGKRARVHVTRAAARKLAGASGPSPVALFGFLFCFLARLIFNPSTRSVRTRELTRRLSSVPQVGRWSPRGSWRWT
jgi:hypothetical protein